MEMRGSENPREIANVDADDGRSPRTRTSAGTNGHEISSEPERNVESEDVLILGSLSRAGGEPASGSLSRLGGTGDGVSVIDLTSGDEGSKEDTEILLATGRERENARGSKKSNAASSSAAPAPNTPRVRRTTRGVGNPTDLTPNFRSAAAMAGWDDEALLIAALGQDSPVQVWKRATGRETPEGPSQVSCSDRCGQCPPCRERKRGTRTPGQAATPLSAAGRHRRLRRISANEGPINPIPMAVLNDENDKNGGSIRKTEVNQLQVSLGGKENKNPTACSKTTSPIASEKVGESNLLKKKSIQLEQLREELTCVICLDICLEPSTTSCGHSFCRSCLQSVFQKCGMRCPKCRQQIRTNCSSSCPINTVLWNTIQLLFPQETATRLEDRKKSIEKEKKRENLHPVATQQPQSQSRAGLVRRVNRPTLTPWRQLTAPRAPEQSRTPGNYRSFQRASTMLESLQALTGERERRVDGHEEPRGTSRRTISLHRNQRNLRQEQEDAALAARLQQSYI